MRILVYEHISGGGFADEPIPMNILSEGFGMSRMLIADFRAAGHNVTAMLDSRIAKLNPPIEANHIVPISSSQAIQVNLRKLAQEVDVAYVIAPEKDGALQSLVEVLEQTGVTSLNCRTNAIKKVSNKNVFYESIRSLGLPLPQTRIFCVNDDFNEIKKAIQSSLNFPVIFKPSDGVSCDGLSLVRNSEEIASAIGKIRLESSNKNFLVQEFIEGAPVSVSLLSTNDKAMAITLNRQDIAIESPKSCSRYNGGAIPFDHPLQHEVFKIAEKLAKSVQGLRGYFGVDFVLTNQEVVVVEVNPRLTTSYIGLRKIVNFNLAQAIINAVLKHELPPQVINCGYTYFSKITTPCPTIFALQKTYGIEEVHSPPFPLSEACAASALISSYGVTLQKAIVGFHEAKKRVLKTINRGNAHW